MDATLTPNSTIAAPSQSGDELSSLKPVDQLKLKITGLVFDLIERTPDGVTPAFSEKVSEILLDKLGSPAENAKVLGRENACTLLRQAQGALAGLKAEFDRQTPIADKNFRKSTMEQLEQMLTELQPAKPAIKEESSLGNKKSDLELTKKILQAANLTREGYLDFLKEHLAPESATSWNAFNLIGAIEKLSYQHPDWIYDRKAAPLVASLLSDRLLSVSKQEGLAITEKSFQVLSRVIPSVAAVFERQINKNPETESAFFKAAATLTSCTTPGNPPGVIDYRFFWPLNNITSAYLSPEGSAALCAYFDQVHQVAGKVNGAENLSTIDSAFRSLKGVTCWADTEQNQQHLKSILTNLNQRLEKNKETITSEALGGILSGLRGIDGKRLAPQVQRELAKTLLLVSIRVSKMEEVPTLKALCKGIHGVAPSLGVTTEPLKSAVSSLMGEFLRRLPEAPKKMSELGYACGALNELVPHVGSFRGLATALWHDVVQRVDYRNFGCDRTSDEDLIAWAVVQQAHLQYSASIPPGLERRLNSLTPNATRMAHDLGSKSENRIAAMLATINGVVVGDKKLLHGFESDRTFTVEGCPGVWGLEVDGSTHLAPGEREKGRRKEGVFAEFGIRVVRVPSNASIIDLRAVIKAIQNGTASTQ
jgi:hypothetical protein